MYNHFYDDNGEFLATTLAREGTTPGPNCIRLENPVEIPSGFWPVTNATKTGFDMVENHRGKEGYVNGELIKITVLGPLPDGWSATPPVLPDVRSAADKRRDAYNVESDSLFLQAQLYQSEAEGMRLLGKEAEAMEAEAHAKDFLKQYAESKLVIRQRFPDDAEPQYRLATSGVYHMQSCSFASASAELLTLAEIAERTGAKPCSRCMPPALPEVPAGE